jgi:hypothetical protein
MPRGRKPGLQLVVRGANAALDLSRLNFGRRCRGADRQRRFDE